MTIRKILNPQRHAITTVNQNGIEVTRLVDYDTYCEEGYKRNAVVFSAVREIARTAPIARMQVARRLEQGQVELEETHPLQKVLDYPNPRQSHVDFVELLQTYLHLDGNVFILREREGGRTKHLWLPRPDKMTPLIRSNGHPWDADALIGYSYATRNGEKLWFMPDEVIHIKLPNPNDTYHGLGRGVPPLMAAAFDADNDNSQTSFIKQFFKNGAVVSGIIKTKNIVDDSEVRRIQSRMAEQYTGEQNWHRMMVLDGDAEFQQTGLDLDEMVFPDLRAISETRICAAFKVPPTLIGVKAGLDASTYSNYAQARKALWEDNIQPTNLKLSAALSRAFADELGEGVIIRHDYAEVVALQEERNKRFERANQGVKGGWMTFDEARREVGMGPLPGGQGQVRFVPLMGQQVPVSGDDGASSPDDALGQLARRPTARLKGVPAAGVEKGFDGMMIAFTIPEAAARALAGAVGELPEGSKRVPVEELHITLALAKPGTEADVAMKAVASVCEKWQAIEGTAGGMIRFAAKDGLTPVCAHFDSPDIGRLREEIVDALGEVGVDVLREHGFTPHITLAYVPAGAAVDVDVPVVGMRFGAVGIWDRGVAQATLGLGQNAKHSASSEGYKEIIYKRFDRVSRAWEGKFAETAKRTFAAEAVGVEAAVNGEKPKSIKAIDYQAIWKAIEAYLASVGMQSWAESFRPIMLGLTNEQVADWAAALGIDWSVENPAVASFIQTYAFEFARKIGETTVETFRTMMDTAREEGWSITKMMEEIRSIYDGWGGHRAEMIARSETIRASNAGAVEAYRQGGILTEEWFATQDERLCAFCGEMHGQTIGVGGVWHAAGSEMVVDGQRLVMDYGDVLWPPLHPECRCTVLPVVEEKLRLVAMAIKGQWVF